MAVVQPFSPIWTFRVYQAGVTLHGMRKEVFRMDRAGVLDLFDRAPVVHLASTRADGAPLFRTVHAVVVDDALAFHGAPAGEKLEAIGREAVVVAEETVASIPSYFVDPERACPATTLFVSAQAHGVVEAVDDFDFKTRTLAAIMKKFQPEGGHVPMEHPMYGKAIDGLLIARVRLERVDGKAKLAQNRTPVERARILERLWARGLPGDADAVERVRAAAPDTPTPGFLVGPEGVSLSCAIRAADVEAAADLVAGEYWNDGVERAALVESIRASTGVVGAHDARTGTLLAFARVVSDRTKHAWLYDVCVAPSWRGRGLGRSVVKLALDHPAARRARFVHLATRDAQRLYESFGFVVRATMPPASSTGSAGSRSTQMILRRPVVS
jgi:ribosomal protein S18 acetylase RimI-like enzyme/predicted FMN-binding regulatory protein PaiB